MALGETSGIAAHLAILHQTTVRAAPVAELQQLLAARGGVITFYNDLKFDDPSFAAFQWLGARGLNTGYDASPGAKLTRQEGASRLARLLSFEGKKWTEPAGDPQALLQGSELIQWLKILCNDSPMYFKPRHPVTTRPAAQTCGEAAVDDSATI